MKKYCFLIFFGLLWAFPASSQSADLSLELSVDDNLVEAGQEVTFTIRVVNDGPDTTLGVKVLSLLPSGYDFVGYKANEGTYDATTGVWDIVGMGFGINAILKVTAIVKNSGEHMVLAEVMASDLLDYDSVPGNGVDTDGDGIIADDPQDEDDGDGQIVVLAGETSDSNCLAPAVKVSSMSSNPTNIDGRFKFDYKIEALLNFKMAHTEGYSFEYGKGNPNQFNMEYYVNSADGSMLFPGGEMGFFKTNFSYSDRFGDVDAAIWLPNGQMVMYGIDKREGKMRAVTRESIQTSEGRYQNDFIQIFKFMESSVEWSEWKEPLPSRVDWRGEAVGYKADLSEAYTGLTNTWIMYFDKAPTPIVTSVPMMGYMVGVLKDIKETYCNRLVVYSKVLIGGKDTGDVIEVELKSIRPMGITFDGTPYQPMGIGGDSGTSVTEKIAEYESKMRDLELRKQSLERQKKRCSTDSCVKAINSKLDNLRLEKQRVICEGMVAAGMEESVADCMEGED
ncbi:MAG: hypothetical protein CMH48_06790 [Muricauda sp.]|nr:DUF11 domain-containing protein [Allomuricauda sp.]MBC30537.1 hypothetical protein [Allomuricauda sp.]